MAETTQGDGYAVSRLDAMGDGYGFRKVRRELGVTAFGINAIVLPPGYDDRDPLPRRAGGDLLRPPRRGRVPLRRRHAPRARPRRRARASTPATHRGMRNVGDGDAIVIVAGGKDGYVGRDGREVKED